MTNGVYAKSVYTSSDVATLSPVQLVVRLYDGAIRSLSGASMAIDSGEILLKIKHISKSMAILELLLSSLDLKVGGEVALNLQKMYIYMLRELATANALDDTEKICHVQDILKTLRDGWRQIEADNKREESPSFSILKGVPSNAPESQKLNVCKAT
ncbi:flagellar export chaperone FliS [Thermodesulfovibrionales bacterium]|nr:flagellar export chaperone FliS [Thermodesulfovibrionales bacterium]